MIVWLNGTHGAGKTTTGALVQQLIPDSRVFDAEKVGETLMDITPGLPWTGNFQDWPPWRPLVVETARHVLDYTGGTLVMPMTVLVEQYWREISAGLAQHGIPVRHFVLHADQETLRGRIEGDLELGPSAFRLQYLEPYAEAARTWLHAEAEVIDTTTLTPTQAAHRIARLTLQSSGSYGHPKPGISDHSPSLASQRPSTGARGAGRVGGMTTGDAKGDLHFSLQAARDALLWKLEGLSEYDARRPLTPTGTNLLGLIKHVASVELGYLGDTFGRPSGEALPWVEEGAEPNADMWATADESREQIVGLYHRAWAHADATLDALPLDAVGTVPWWPSHRAEVTLHHAVVRVIGDTHRHAGHADIVRELIDGAAGTNKGNDNIPPGDAAWWADHRSRLERAAREAWPAAALPLKQRTPHSEP